MTNTVAIPITFNKNDSKGSKPRDSTHSFIKELEISMMPMFTKQLAISMEASKVLGVSSKFTMRLYDGCCLVLSILMSLSVREKKATSDPANKNESRKRIKSIKTKTVVAAGVKARSVSN
jgi:hypothetical protein